MRMASTFSFHLLTALLVPAPFALMGISQCCTNPDVCADNDGDDWTEEQGDCNDADPNISPSAVELCNGIDDNCNSEVDEGAGELYYMDADADGYGSGDGMVSCEVPTGYTTMSGDCDDSSGSVYPGAADLCEDSIDQDCSGADATCGSAGEVAFTDGSGDDAAATVVWDFFSGNTFLSTDYLYFSISGSSGYDGAWCSENAAWYQTQYLTYATSAGFSVNSGSWNRWYRSDGGSWNGPINYSYTNYYGPYCDGMTYSWCSEWGINGMYLGVMPARGGDYYNESYAGDWSYGAGWKVNIRGGSDRMSVCGF